MTEHISLPSRKRLLELFEYDPQSGHLIRRVGVRGYAAGARAGRLRADGYRRMKVDGVKYLEHRIIFRLCTGIDAGDFEIDHDNRIKDDNRISNLRIATRPQQGANRTGVIGCRFHKAVGQYLVAIAVDGQQRYLGYWPTEEIARAVYATAAAEVHGEFAPELPPNPFGFVNTHWGKCSDGSHKGVHFNKASGKWRASITIDGKRKHLGSFPTKEEARRARLAAEEEFAAA